MTRIGFVLDAGSTPAVSTIKKDLTRQEKRVILEKIKKLLPNITIFLITHRDKSLEFCDEVINFEK